MALKEGTLDLQFADREIIRALGEACDKAVYGAAVATLADANSMIPIETGEAQASGYVEMKPGDFPTALIGYRVSYARRLNYDKAQMLRSGRHYFLSQARRRTGAKLLRQFIKQNVADMTGGQ